jgi:hypothetical protein
MKTLTIIALLAYMAWFALKTTLALAMFLAVLYYMASMGAGAGA